LLAYLFLHWLAGAVAGSVFQIRTLVLLLGIVLLESAAAAFVYGGSVALWALANLFALQVGYLVGIYARSILEQAGQLLSRARPRELP